MYKRVTVAVVVEVDTDEEAESLVYKEAESMYNNPQIRSYSIENVQDYPDFTEE